MGTGCVFIRIPVGDGICLSQTKVRVNTELKFKDCTEQGLSDGHLIYAVSQSPLHHAVACTRLILFFHGRPLLQKKQRRKKIATSLKS